MRKDELGSLLWFEFNGNKEDAGMVPLLGSIQYIDWGELRANIWLTLEIL